MSLQRSNTWPALVVAVAAIALAVAPIQAQTGAVTGQVTDATSLSPVDGAQVSIDGSNRGSLTNASGRYLLTGVPAGTYLLRVTHIGYRTQEQEITVADGGTAQADFTMAVSAVSLDELVVTGTAGAVERRKLGTSVASIDLSNVQEVVPVEGFSHSLEARIPGVRSIGTAGGVGAGRSLQVRGVTSFNLSQRPVVYIDGVKVDTNGSEWTTEGDFSGAGATCCSFSGGAGEDRLSDINPEEIDRIEVLKGAAAATLYGSEASGGVIQIFTKRGRSNSPPQFTFSSSVGFNRHRANFPTSLYPNFTGPDGFRALDANESLIENGLVNSYDLTAQGGGEDVTYFISGGFSFEEGSVQPNHQKRGNLRMNLNWTASEKWTVGVNSAYSRNRVLDLQSGNNWMSLLGNATLGNPQVATEEAPYGEPWIPVSNIQQVETYSDATRWTGGVNISFTPSQNFSHKLTLGLDDVSDQKARLLPFGNFIVYAGEDGERNIGYRASRTLTMEYLGNLSFGLSESIGSDFSFGAQGFWEKEGLSMATGRVFAGPGVTTVGGAANTFGDESFFETINVGLFAQNRFDFGDQLFATVGLRVDGNSAFGENYGLQPYPKADVAYNLTPESLPGFVSNLKVRVAWGQAGRSPGAFDQFQTFNPTSVLNDLPGVTPSNPGNADLEPEKTTEMEAGFDMGLFEDVLGLSVTAYHATTRDALLEVDLPPSEGFDDERLINAGKIRNVGVEMQLNATPVATQAVRWSTTFNVDWNNNEILDLGESATVDPNTGERRLGDFREGRAVRALYGRIITGYDPTTVTHTRTNFDTYLGDPLPHWNASWSNTLSLGAFRIYGQLRGSWGAIFNNGDRPYRIRQGGGDEFLRLLNPDGSATTQSDSLVNYWTLATAYDSRDNIRLQEVSLSYTLPENLAQQLGLGRTALTLSGYNLHWWDDCNCMDPDMQYQSASDTNFSGFLAHPQPRKFLFSIRTSF